MSDIQCAARFHLVGLGDVTAKPEGARASRAEGRGVEIETVLPSRLAAVFSSPAPLAHELAMTLASKVGVEAETVAGFTERGPSPEPAQEVEAAADTVAEETKVPTQGPSRSQVSTFVNEIEGIADNYRGEDILILATGALVEAVLADIGEVPGASFVASPAVISMTRVDVDADGWAIRKWIGAPVD